MNKALKDKWLAALRSGEYKQGMNCLMQESPEGERSYCCLGVLCDVSDTGEWEQRTVGGEVQEQFYWRSMDNQGRPTINTADVPDHLAKPWGLLERSEPLSDKQSRLMHMNDDGQFSFNEIADWIEENIPTNGDDQ